jgi:peptide methionine sulfoxide reductase MsrA
MPSVSKKQHNFMNAVKHNRKFAKKVDVPQSVAEEYIDADELVQHYIKGKPSHGDRKRPRKAGQHPR